MGRYSHYQKVHLHIAIPNRIWHRHDFTYLTGTARQEVTARERDRARRHTEKDKSVNSRVADEGEGLQLITTAPG
jgi:hypothetical protein